MANNFLKNRNFHSASLKDLLDARENYHIHLSHLENVVATAIGKYRIRISELDTNDNIKKNAKKGKREPKTLENTRVTNWSWPCILVFVNDWKKDSEFCENPDQAVPKLLYMPDGRVVPTCVIYIEDKEISPPALQYLSFPSELIGGGYPITTKVQEETHIASIGCLVTDGDLTYALTNKHVTGESGREIYSYFKGKETRIGESSDKCISKLKFNELYPEWPGSRVFSNLDAGLIKIDDVSQWTAQVFGIGEIDRPINLNTKTISLELIGCPLKAFGAASGVIEGEIQALFYRYKSIGGYDYAADLMIGKRAGSKNTMNTTHGDSGTLWFWDNSADNKIKKHRPIALQWGGHRVISGSSEKQFQFALATFISNVCVQLDVELIRGWNIGFNEYWGKTGHYKIAAKACELISSKKLNTLMINNMDRIGFSDEAIENGDLKKIGKNDFIPLADVPDLVWRTTRKKDSSNHFADMDQEGKGKYKGKTLLEMCKDEKNLDSKIWDEFYDSLGIKDKDKGALPFRVWEMYNEMVSSLKKKDTDRFVCAAGIVSHYVADACEPLHVSYLHHGTGPEEEKKVHSFYESNILDRKSPEIIAGVNDLLKKYKVKNTFSGGKKAAFFTVELMRTTFKKLPPMDVIDAFNEKSGRERGNYMWKVLGEKTNELLAEGCKALAELWQSAWIEGNGDSIPNSKLKTIDTSRLKKLYMDRNFLEAKRLNEMNLK